MKQPKPIVHLREIFWRPDILAQHQVEGTANVTMCAEVLPSAHMTCDTRLITCECCQRNFIEGLITGDGTKLTYEQYAAQKVEHTFPTLKERAEAAAAAEAAGVVTWATEAAPVSQAALDKLKPSAGGWSTTPSQPANNGWTTGR